MCLICDRIEMIKNDTNKYFVKEDGNTWGTYSKTWILL